MEEILHHQTKKVSDDSPVNIDEHRFQPWLQRGASGFRSHPQYLSKFFVLEPYKPTVSPKGILRKTSYKASCNCSLICEGRYVFLHNSPDTRAQRLRRALRTSRKVPAGGAVTPCTRPVFRSWQSSNAPRAEKTSEATELLNLPL